MYQNLFISYSDKDRNKLEALSKAIRNSSGKIKLITVAKRKIPGKPLSDKVKEGIIEAVYFVPILTRSSIRNQWVNQEIGFATANHRNIIPLVEKSIVNKLKGFIHNQIDLPFTFEGNRSNKQKEARSFRKCYKDIIYHLENDIVEPFLKSHISPKKVKQGENYTTKVHFIGKVKNAFFDNYVKHLGSTWIKWNWDTSTLKNARANSPGELHGMVDTKSKYTYSTSGWPIGKYKISTRVYEHPIPGKATRYIVIEKQHDFEVV